MTEVNKTYPRDPAKPTCFICLKPIQGMAIYHNNDAFCSIHLSDLDLSILYSYRQTLTGSKDYYTKDQDWNIGMNELIDGYKNQKLFQNKLTPGRRFETCIACCRIVTIKDEKFQELKDFDRHILYHFHGTVRDKFGLVSSIIICQMCLNMSDKDCETLRDKSKNYLLKIEPKTKDKPVNKNLSLNVLPEEKIQVLKTYLDSFNFTLEIASITPDVSKDVPTVDKIKSADTGKRLLIFGAPGSGKSTLSDMMPDKVLDLDSLVGEKDAEGHWIYNLTKLDELDKKTAKDIAFTGCAHNWKDWTALPQFQIKWLHGDRNMLATIYKERNVGSSFKFSERELNWAEEMEKRFPIIQFKDVLELYGRRGISEIWQQYRQNVESFRKVFQNNTHIGTKLDDITSPLKADALFLKLQEEIGEFKEASGLHFLEEFCDVWFIIICLERQNFQNVIFGEHLRQLHDEFIENGAFAVIFPIHLHKFITRSLIWHKFGHPHFNSCGKMSKKYKELNERLNGAIVADEKKSDDERTWLIYHIMYRSHLSKKTFLDNAKKLLANLSDAIKILSKIYKKHLELDIQLLYSKIEDAVVNHDILAGK